MRKRRKSQIQMQVFVFILSMVLASLLLIYGYNAINTFREQEKYVEHLRFKMDMKNYVRSIRSSFGDADLKSIIVPQGYKEICFVATDAIGTTNLGQFDGWPIMKDSVESRSEQNIFMIDYNSKITKHAFYLGNISVSYEGTAHDFYCFPVKSSILKIKLEALGNKVDIGDW